MQYCAIVNTATPATGLITVGEVLTERQAEALGQNKLDELVRGGVLRVLRDAPLTHPSNATDEPITARDEPVTDDDDEELPILEATDEIVADEKPAKRRKRGSMKGKEEQN